MKGRTELVHVACGEMATGVGEVPSDVLPHVYSFLVENNFNKAANSLVKECGAVGPCG